MRKLTSKRLLQAASLLLAAITALFAVLWAVRGIRPAIACGLMDALARGDWPAVYACIDLAEYDALIAGGALAGSILTWIASRKASGTPLGDYSPTPVEQARNRHAMLDRVQATWIDGLLDQVLYQSVLMSLGMTWRPALLRPGSLRLHRPGGQERPVPIYVPNLQLFDEAGHILLILGEPGSGKTTMMLDLARKLLEQARAAPTVPIPVVFNLSSFTEAEQSLADWLTGEFRRSYDVPEKLARYWLAHNELALLLDGLDEVRADRRAGVVEKLIRYRSEQLAPWLVICCRKNEYAELSATGSALADVDAVVLQPLTPDQIEGYLADLEGSEPRLLWRALHSDTALLEVADTPLMVNVMLLAAGALDWDALPSPRTPEIVRSHIYDAYLRSMLERPRKAGPRYPSAKILHWLRWLAGRMVEHGQTVFLLERMNRSWFNRPWQRYIWILVFGLIGGLGAGLSAELTLGLIFGLLIALIFGPSDIEVKERVRFKLKRVGLIFGWIFVLSFILISKLAGWLIGVLVFVLIFGLASVLTNTRIEERMRYKFDCIGLIFGLIGGLILALIFWLNAGPIGGLIGLTIGVSIKQVFTLIARLTFGLVDRSTEFEQNYRRGHPNIAIHRSLLNGLIFGLNFALITGLFSGLIAGLFLGISVGLNVGLSIGLIFGLGGGLFLGLTFGWEAAIKHYTLRLALFFDGSIPLNYVRFLDYCADRILLRKVGGGYIFVHRTFMEHVAGFNLRAPQSRSGL